MVQQKTKNNWKKKNRRELSENPTICLTQSFLIPIRTKLFNPSMMKFIWTMVGVSFNNCEDTPIVVAYLFGCGLDDVPVLDGDEVRSLEGRISDMKKTQE